MSVTGDEQQDGAHDAGEVGQERDRQRCGRGVGGVEGRDADDKPEQDAGPEGDPGDERGRGSCNGAQSTLPRPCARCSSNLAAVRPRAQPTRGESHADQGKYGQGDKEGQDTGQDGDEQRKNAVERLMERLGHMVPDRNAAGSTGGSGDLVRSWL
jgi:hypothetical protein